MIDQTTHERQIATSASTLAVASVAHPGFADLALVSVPADGVNLVHHILNNHITTASIRLPMTAS